MIETKNETMIITDKDEYQRVKGVSTFKHEGKYIMDDSGQFRLAVIPLHFVRVIDGTIKAGDILKHKDGTITEANNTISCEVKNYEPFFEVYRDVAKCSPELVHRMAKKAVEVMKEIEKTREEPRPLLGKYFKVKNTLQAFCHFSMRRFFESGKVDFDDLHMLARRVSDEWTNQHLAELIKNIEEYPPVLQTAANNPLPAQYPIWCKFKVGDALRITALDNMPCTVIGYRLEGRNLFVDVSYWLDGKNMKAYLNESELEAIK